MVMSRFANANLVVDEPAFKQRSLKIACIGAGFSGLTLAYKLQHQSDNSHFDLEIFEKNGDVGGTWLENVYPGVACDIPAHSYVFPFAPNPDWSAYYVSGPEILAYIKGTVRQYSLDKNVRLNTQVVGAEWDDTSGQWSIITQNGSGTPSVTKADFLVNAGGFLNNPQWPDIDGLSSFRGELVHSAMWPKTLDWQGKRVGLIGNGSSAIQILPQIVAEAKHVVTYIRNPTWVSTPLANDQRRGGRNFSYSDGERVTFREHPEALREVRKDIEHRMNARFPGVIAGSDMSQETQAALTRLMQQRLGNDPDMIARLIPEFPALCRRITPGEGYLEALCEDKVTVRFDRIGKVSPGGITLTRAASCQGGEDEEDALDIIICATGFNVSFLPEWPISGRHGKTLAEEWRSYPEAYLGIAVPSMPNYFMSGGPNSPVSQGSLTTMIDFATDYMIRWWKKMAAQRIKSIVVNGTANREYNEYIQDFLQQTVWAGDCRSWYKNGARKGKVTGIYGGSMVHYYEALQAFRTEDYDIEYLDNNRFTFLGNGQSMKEFKGENLGFYV